jgi:Ca-activated chloride channel family protein
VAVVAYAGGAGVVLPPTSATEQRRILGAIAGLEAGGSTAMGQGIDLAYRLALDTLRDGETSRVVIASDGDANVGVTSPDALTAMIRGYADRGITLTTLGFGQGNYQDFRMEQLANDGDGNYFYVDSADEARRVFVDELASTLEVIARDVKIQVEWNPDAVERYRLIGYENRAIADRDFRNDRVDAGEIGAGHTVTALYQVALRPGGSDRVATVRMRAKPPGADAAATERTYTLPRVAVQPSFAAASPDHRMAVAMAAFAERLRASPHVEGVSYERIAGLVADAVRPGHDEDQEVLELVRRAAALDPQ